MQELSLRHVTESTCWYISTMLDATLTHTHTDGISHKSSKNDSSDPGLFVSCPTPQMLLFLSFSVYSCLQKKKKKQAAATKTNEPETRNKLFSSLSLVRIIRNVPNLKEEHRINVCFFC